jgi:acyl-CoA thioester hydrolase
MAPAFDQYRDTVRPEWIDENDHLNMGYYVVVFDFATDSWLAHIGLGAEHKRENAVTTFTLEAHVNYLREVGEGDPLRFSTQLIDYDEKRVHYIHTMRHAEDGYVAATNELMTLHVSQQTRRAAPMAAQVIRRLAEIKKDHADLDLPAEVGRHVGFGQRP